MAPELDMSITEILERRVARPLVMLLVSIVGVTLTYYALREQRPAVIYDVIGEANVLDVRRTLPELEVLFQGENIQQEGQNLRVINLRIQNVGGVDILQSHFDEREDWGLSVEPGRIVEVRMRGSNSEYLDRNLEPLIVDQTRLVLPKVIFERGKFFALELLVIHPRGELPEIRPAGKIAGIDSILVVRSSLTQSDKSVWQRSFEGSPNVQVVRIVGYVLAAFAIMAATALVVALFSAVSSWWQKRLRRRRIHRLQRNGLIGDGKYFHIFSQAYEKAGTGPLIEIARTLDDPEGLAKLAELGAGHAVLRHHRRRHDMQFDTDPRAVIVAEDAKSREFRLTEETLPLLKRLFEADVMSYDESGGKLKDPTALDELKEFLATIIGKGGSSSAVGLPRNDDSSVMPPNEPT